MDREKLLQRLDAEYVSSTDLINHIPLGVKTDVLWDELLGRRRARATTLPLRNCLGGPYWYVVTDKMVAASERIVEALLESDAHSDLYTDPPPVMTLEEVFFTSYVEGSKMTMQDAMHFLQSGLPPKDIEEQLIVNNRQAGAFASGSLHQRIGIEELQTIAFILTDGMDEGRLGFRLEDHVDIPAMGDEDFVLPSSVTVPDRASEFISFLSDSSQHPLIKAAVAQAWILAVRPFSEGNERLGRLVSNMILLRAGYSFLKDVSISALIARKSYGYYEAMANIIRAENGGDLTYFLEYYLEILSRAVDEHRLKQQQKAEQLRNAEVEMAHLPLKSAAPIAFETQSPPAAAGIASPSADAEQGETSNEEGSLDSNVISELPAESETLSEENNESTISQCLERVQYELYMLAEGSRGNVRNAAQLLASFIGDGIGRFTTADVAAALSITAEQASNAITAIKARDLIETVGRVGSMAEYAFAAKMPPFTANDYSKTTLRYISKLIASSHSSRDKRLGEVLKRCLPKGFITTKDYETASHPDRWKEDMKLAMQMGLVERVSTGIYLLQHDVPAGYPRLRPQQKEALTRMFGKHGRGEFTLEMFLEEFTFSSPHACAILHELELFGVVGCRRKGVTHYHILVNPRENPECFVNAA